MIKTLKMLYNKYLKIYKSLLILTNRIRFNKSCLHQPLKINYKIKLSNKLIAFSRIKVISNHQFNIQIIGANNNQTINITK